MTQKSLIEIFQTFEQLAHFGMNEKGSDRELFAGEPQRPHPRRCMSVVAELPGASSGSFRAIFALGRCRSRHAGRSSRREFVWARRCRSGPGRSEVRTLRQALRSARMFLLVRSRGALHADT